ncbi:MAG: L-threonylcarbamoyladenylate synthase [Sphaerochaetaceae bacterium]|jgi:L-threonylcarbamoyladenylate synthase|nr:L-threonylcarbamoyladenylate synthase [Sphaerochaetaceae bacterium]
MIVERKVPGSAHILAEHLRNGEIAIIPCDTIYGIVGADPESEPLLRMVKGRAETKPFIRLVNEAMALRIAADPLPPEVLALWPGPLTAIVRTATENTCAIRIPADEFLQEVLSLLGRPIFSTSVNVSGEPSLEDFEAMVMRFGQAVPLFIRGDAHQGTVPSTIVDITKRPFSLVRQGAADVSSLL